MCHNWSRQLDATTMRQRRPSDSPPAPSVEDDLEQRHQHIPRNADGIPVYFILPAENQAEHDEQMARCEAGWRETGDPAFIGEAIGFAQAYRQPLPHWLGDAVLALTIDRRNKGHVAQEHSAAARWRRYRAVCDARQRDLSWTDAYEDAAAQLADTDARGEAPTMKASYVAVKADLRNGRHGRYEQPLLPNQETQRRLGGATRRKSSPR
jgi:hypothetical protein